MSSQPAPTTSTSDPDPVNPPEMTDLQLAEATSAFFDSQASLSPLVDSLTPLDELRAEYMQPDSPPTYLRKCNWLGRRGWNGIRRLRGDGSCGYRALAFAYCEQLVDQPSSVVQAALKNLVGQRPLLERAGFDKSIIEEFEEPLFELLSLPSSSPLTLQRVHDDFNDAMKSNYLVTYLRLLTSAYLRAHPDDFVPFLWALPGAETFMLSEEPVTEFCAMEVEPATKEMDHVQLVALTRALSFAISAAYLDQHAVVADFGPSGGAGEGEEKEGEDESRVVFHHFRDESEGAEARTVLDATGRCALLFRIGHFDLIYKNQRD